METKTTQKISEYCVFVYKRGNSFNGLKLNEDGSIICDIKQRKDTEGVEYDYPDKNELTIEHGYGPESNSDAYRFLNDTFLDGDVLRITTIVDENGVFRKEIKKVMNKDFCINTKKSWDNIKHLWFRPKEASERIEKHLEEI